MGAIYRAARPLLGDEVAVKVMRASFDAPSDGRQRFLRESRACAQLRHPNIVSILDFNVDPAGQPYLVMELLSGPSLREELELSAPMTPEAVAAILTPVASALQLAHDRGITHRDLKPANIVAHRYESGERVYKVIDFGLVSVKSRQRPAGTHRAQHVHGHDGLRRAGADSRRATWIPRLISTRLASSSTRCSPAAGRSRRRTS